MALFDLFKTNALPKTQWALLEDTLINVNHIIRISKEDTAGLVVIHLSDGQRIPLRANLAEIKEFMKDTGIMTAPAADALTQSEINPK